METKKKEKNLEKKPGRNMRSSRNSDKKVKQIQDGIYKENQKLYTANAVKDQKVYGEQLLNKEGVQYRNWQPSRSKAGAAVMKNIELGLEKTSEVLYLGAASGTTVSHFSDILSRGFIYGVEYSDTVIQDLVKLAEKRENIAPILGDAQKPENYEELIQEKVDIVFQDISQSNQPEIFLKNARKYLKRGGIGLLSVKAHSISTSRNEEEIFDEVKNKIQKDFNIVSETKLEPYEKNHLFLKMCFTGGEE